MFKEFADLKEVYTNRFKVITTKLNKLNGLLVHDVKIGSKSISYKTSDYGTPTFISRLEDIMDNHAIISFEFTEKVRQNGEYSKKKEYYRGKKHFEEIMDIMREFWFSYLQLKKLDGLVFVSDENYFDENLVLYFTKKHRFSSNAPLEKIIKKKTGKNVFHMILSNHLIKKSEQFMTAKHIFSNLVSKEPLLIAYDDEFFKLFFKGIQIEYVGTSFKLSFKDSTFTSIEITALNSDINIPAKTLVSMNETDLHRYFEDVKTNQQLLNLVRNPMHNFKKVFTSLGLSLEESKYASQAVSDNFKKKRDKLEYIYTTLQGTSDWEFVESEMGFILNEIKAENHKPIIDSVSKNRNKEYFHLQVYHFTTDHANYFIVLNRNCSLTTDYYPNNGDEEFALFVSKEEKDEELQRFVYSMLLKNSI